MPEPLVVFDCVVFLQGPHQRIRTRSYLYRAMNWDTKEGRDFQSRFPQLKILNPVDFLKALK